MACVDVRTGRKVPCSSRYAVSPDEYRARRRSTQAANRALGGSSRPRDEEQQAEADRRSRVLEGPGPVKKRPSPVFGGVGKTLGRTVSRFGGSLREAARSRPSAPGGSLSLADAFAGGVPYPGDIGGGGSSLQYVNEQIAMAQAELARREMVATDLMNQYRPAIDRIFTAGEGEMVSREAEARAGQEQAGLTPFMPAGATIAPVRGAYQAIADSRRADEPVLRQAMQGQFASERNRLGIEAAGMRGEAAESAASRAASAAAQNQDARMAYARYQADLQQQALDNEFRERKLRASQGGDRSQMGEVGESEISFARGGRMKTFFPNRFEQVTGQGPGSAYERARRGLQTQVQEARQAALAGGGDEGALVQSAIGKWMNRWQRRNRPRAASAALFNLNYQV